MPFNGKPRPTGGFARTGKDTLGGVSIRPEVIVLDGIRVVRHEEEVHAQEHLREPNAGGFQTLKTQHCSKSARIQTNTSISTREVQQGNYTRREPGLKSDHA